METQIKQETETQNEEETKTGLKKIWVITTDPAIERGFPLCDSRLVEKSHQLERTNLYREFARFDGARAYLTTKIQEWNAIHSPQSNAQTLEKESKHFKVDEDSSKPGVKVIFALKEGSVTENPQVEKLLVKDQGEDLRKYKAIKQGIKKFPNFSSTRQFVTMKLAVKIEHLQELLEHWKTAEESEIEIVNLIEELNNLTNNS